MESKEYRWAWVTDDLLLSMGACELCFVMITSDKTDAYVSIYDGENTTETLIATIKGRTDLSVPVAFPQPIFCRKGLYIDLANSPVGVLVQWRELGSPQ